MKVFSQLLVGNFREKTLSVHVPDGAKKVFLNNAESKKVCSRDCLIAGARALFF